MSGHSSLSPHFFKTVSFDFPQNPSSRETLHVHKLSFLDYNLTLKGCVWYYKGMKNNTKSSITLPPKELALVTQLQRLLKAKSKVEVIRMGLKKLQEETDRNALRLQFATAAKAVAKNTKGELKELEALISDGLEDK